LERKIFAKVLNVLIAMVWLVNGLACKVLNLIPRHEEMVGRILGSSHSRTLTLLIGISEIVMAVWILSRFKSKLNAIVQIAIVLAMNIIEVILVPDLLYWGNLNFMFAMLFIGIVFYTEFVIEKNKRPEK